MFGSRHIDDMPANKISSELERLYELQRSGEITPRQADRLRALEDAAKRCEPRQRKAYWL